MVSHSPQHPAGRTGPGILDGIDALEFPIDVDEAARRLRIPEGRRLEFAVAVKRLRRRAE